MRLRVYADSAELNDVVEVRCLVGEVPGSERPPGHVARHDDVLRASFAIGTLHAGDLQAMCDMATPGREDMCNGRIMAFFTDRVMAMLAAHRLEVDAGDLNETWRSLDMLARSVYEPGPPWIGTVEVRATAGAAEPRLRH